MHFVLQQDIFCSLWILPIRRREGVRINIGFEVASIGSVTEVRDERWRLKMNGSEVYASEERMRLKKSLKTAARTGQDFGTDLELACAFVSS